MNSRRSLCIKPFSGLLAVMAVLAVTILIPSLLSAADTNSVADDWQSWRFLIGDWVAEGGGQPGQGAGTFTFRLDLQQKVLVRKSHTDYPATKDKAAFSHDDLMVVYQQPQQPARAIYFDNEGHVINYAAAFSANIDTLVFTSDVTPGAPRFRLSYCKMGADSLKIMFAIASPDKPEQFATYVQGTAGRAK